MKVKVLLPFDLSEKVIQQIREHMHKIALALKTVGLVNIQFAIKDEVVYVIEANPRASRTVPFVAKAYGEPYVNWATKVMLGAKLKDFQFKPRLDGYAIGARLQLRQVPQRGQEPRARDRAPAGDLFHQGPEGSVLPAGVWGEEYVLE